MASASKIADELYLVKLRRAGGTANVTLPADVREKVGFFPERGFIAVRAVGPVIVLAQVRQATPDGAADEIGAAMDAAVREWLSTPEHAAAVANSSHAKSENKPSNGAAAANGAKK